MILGVTGIRNLCWDCYPDVELAMRDALAAYEPTEIRFGGAIGSDTVALEAIGEAECDLVAVVPFRLADQPRDAQRVMTEFADRIVELELPRAAASYLRRNDVLLLGGGIVEGGRADRLLAFTDGRTTGGSAYTVKKARELDIPVDVVLVRGEELSMNARVEGIDAPGSIFAWLPWDESRFFRFRAAVYDMKDDIAPPLRVYNEILAGLAKQIADHDELQHKRFIVPMPRRLPGPESDLTRLAQDLAERTHKLELAGWLKRVRVPEGGIELLGRVRHLPEEHARSMRVVGDHAVAKDVLLLDNVVTTGGTAAGAQIAAKQQTGTAPPILSIFWSEEGGSYVRGRRRRFRP